MNDTNKEGPMENVTSVLMELDQEEEHTEEEFEDEEQLEFDDEYGEQDQDLLYRDEQGLEPTEPDENEKEAVLIVEQKNNLCPSPEPPVEPARYVTCLLLLVRTSF